jgi:hypothetical protein
VGVGIGVLSESPLTCMVVLSVQSNELDAVVYEAKITIKLERKLFTKKMA